MLTVRYPDGVVVTYNNANQLSYSEGVWILFKNYGVKNKDGEEKKDWVASIQVSAGVIVECQPACKVNNSLKNISNENALRFVVEHLTEFDGSSQEELLKQLKSKLTKYNSQTGLWKNE